MQKHSVVFFLRISDILTLTTLTEDSASGSLLYQMNWMLSVRLDNKYSDMLSVEVDEL